jgi:hypothetical protein
MEKKDVISLGSLEQSMSRQGKKMEGTLLS